MLRFRRRWLIAASAVLVLVAVVLVLRWLDPPALPEGFAAANGRLEATQVDIATKQAGRLSEILVREGDSVSREQVIARMDVAGLEAELRQAQAQLEEAVQAMHAAEANVVRQESTVEFAAAEFERSQSLYEQELITQQESDLARSRLESEQAGLNAAQAAVSQAEAAIAAAQARIDVIESNLDDSLLRSPITGRVLYRLAEPGEVLPAGGHVLTLIDVSDLYMTAFLPTAQAGRVGIGSEARIVLDARPGIAIPARISFVSPEAQFTPRDVETEGERERLMFRIRAHVDAQWVASALGAIPTGLPGMLYVRLEPTAEWPAALQPSPAPE